MATNRIPEKLINFRVYKDNIVLLGQADVQLPSIEMITDSIKGAGIAGEIDSPALGQTQSMTVTINFRSTTKDMASLASGQAHELDIRGAAQVYDSGDGKLITQPIKVTLRAMTKKIDLGKLEAAASQEASWEGEVVYIKVSVAEVEIIEIDKFNFIHKINGEDSLADTRTALGMV
jgi:P2 family phage contractile tail tube protein